MRRLVIAVLAALMLSAGVAHAAPQKQRPAAAALYYSSYGHPHSLTPPAPSPAVSEAADGPSWTAAILAGAGLIVAFGSVGVLAGRATVRPKPTA
jgi:hypothetical protein